MRQQISLISVILMLIQILIGCTSHGPAEIHYGQDQCDYCNMNIVDKSFGSQLVTTKGKAYKFDSIECLAAFGQTSENEITRQAFSWITDFKNPGKFVSTDSAVVVFGEGHNSPMGVGLVGFSTDFDADSFIKENSGQKMSWPETVSLVKTKWKL